jgi:hypothetical protein
LGEPQNRPELSATEIRSLKRKPDTADIEARIVSENLGKIGWQLIAAQIKRADDQRSISKRFRNCQILLQMRFLSGRFGAIEE